MRSRRLTQMLLAGGVSALAVGGFAPTVANAAGADSITVAGGGSYTYTFNQSPQIEATAQPNCRSALSRPGQVTVTIAGPAVSNGTLIEQRGDCNKTLTISPSSGAVNTRHPKWTGGSVAASNGTYTVTLNNQGRTSSASFTLLIPPARPTGFTVTPQSPSTASFAWTANTEPDITGYRISNTSGTVAELPSSVCSSGACSSGPVDLGGSVSGKTSRFALTALRSCGNAECSAGHVASTASASGSATFPAAPTPTPTPTPTKSTGGGGNHGGGTSLGTVHSNGSSGGNHSGSVNLGNADPSGQVSHNLPPVGVGSVPSVKAPRLPPAGTAIQPLDLGEKPGKIKYPKPLLATQNQADKGLVQDLKSGLTTPPLWRGIAAAAVLILIAVHLRAWVQRTEAF